MFRAMIQRSSIPLLPPIGPFPSSVSVSVMRWVAGSTPAFIGPTTPSSTEGLIIGDGVGAEVLIGTVIMGIGINGVGTNGAGITGGPDRLDGILT